MTTVIRFRDVTKRFRIHHTRPFLARELFRLIIQRPSQSTEHVALDGISFDVQAGESIGVIGPNGAGKSTLLSLIAQTAYPSTGTVEVQGRVGPLLELGAGFHPDLTGYENVFLNAMLLGLTRNEIEERFESVAEFAELGDFLDAPIGTYSTGMRARLGFAVVAHVDADIILLDEILGVGDNRFRSKCRDTLDGFRERGRTLFLVSHALADIERMCDRVLWIDGGRLQADGPATEVLSEYRAAT